MPTLTNRQWEEYQAIIKKCQTMEIEARSCRALDAQLKQAQEKVSSLEVQLSRALAKQDELETAWDKADDENDALKAELAAAKTELLNRGAYPCDVCGDPVIGGGHGRDYDPGTNTWGRTLCDDCEAAGKE